MLDTIHEAQEKFQAIERLLNAPQPEEGFITALSEMTQDAYIAINDGMNENTTFCHECARYRDYLKDLLPTLEHLKEDIPSGDAYASYFDNYRTMIREILERITAVR